MLFKKNPFLVFAIETSCDDTAVAIVSSCRKVLSQVIINQHARHQPYRGIVPKIAAQLHRENLPSAIRQCISQAGLSGIQQVDVIAATRGPGLASSLSAGFEAGRCIAAATGLPFYPVHHMEGHTLMARFSDESIKFPFLCLLISGGHTMIVLVRNVGDYTILGTTLDDSIGEALDKATVMLDIPLLADDSPAAALERTAELCNRTTDLKLPCPLAGSKAIDFSFSGLKTALKYSIKNRTLSFEEKSSLAFEFQRAATAHLEDRLKLALHLCDGDIKDVVISGGVARNQFVRQRLTGLIEGTGKKAKFAPFEYCSDNAVMIGWAAIENILTGKSASTSTDVLPVWPLDSLKLQ